MIDEHDIYRAYPKAGFEGFALAAIRVAMKSVPPAALLEFTRRFSESWRGVSDLSQCPYAYEWFKERDFEKMGPRRVTKEPRDPERPLYRAVDIARAHGAPDAQLEADTLRKL